MENLELVKIVNVIEENNFKKLAFANENDLDNKELLQKNATLCKFKSMGFLSLKLRGCIFERNTFDNCYFRNAEFIRTSFEGSKFIMCNFSGVKFIGCNLDYTIFRDCAVDYEAIKESLPTRLNLRKQICKNLAMEHLKLGNTKEYKNFFFDERESSRKTHKSKFIFKDEYTREKYNIEDAISGFKNYVLITIDKELWGYGEKISTVLRNLIFINVFYFIYFNFFLLIDQNEKIKIGLKELILNFMNISTPDDYIKYWGFISHRILGILLCGLLIATLFRMVNKR